MAQMAEAFRLKDRNMLLAAAKAICDHVKIVSTDAEAAVKDCVDPVLKKSVTTGVQGMRNMAVQLKIVAAVKATSIEVGATDDDSQVNTILSCIL